MDDGSARVEVRSPNGPLWALIDASDLDLVLKYSWRATIESHTTYARTAVRMNGRRPEFRMHRLILDAPAGWDVDHVNGNGLDNRRSNLRLATRSQNRANTRARVSGLSTYKGVTWHRRDCRWQAQLAGTYLGSYLSEEEAAQAYDLAALARYGSEWALLNFPEAGRRAKRPG